MAIDTEDKRRSVQAYTLGLLRPVADASVDTQDRPTVGWFYSGITYSAAAAVVYHLIRTLTRAMTRTLTRKQSRNDT
jgi:hypothetical protein